MKMIMCSVGEVIFSTVWSFLSLQYMVLFYCIALQFIAVRLLLCPAPVDYKRGVLLRIEMHWLCLIKGQYWS